ncbi:hypothetical protein [Streptomyces sp. NPDC053720]|uniref:hypothetical protein n=1 Tax=Streptomyces sp. NPDC053720 TaxID=3154855 RepID=UPI0034489FCE
MRARRQATAVIDLDASYTYATPGFPEPQATARVKVRKRVRDGVTSVSVRGLAALLVDRIEAIADLGDRLHTLMLLDGAYISVRDAPALFAARLFTTRDEGRVSTTYPGTRDLPVSEVLDLAERLREQLLGGAAVPGPEAAPEPRPEPGVLTPAGITVPWGEDHPDKKLLDEAVAAGASLERIVGVTGDLPLQNGSGLDERGRAAVRSLVREAAAEAATPRQVQYILDLLAERQSSGEGGGFYRGPEDAAGVARLTRTEASAYIDSLKGAY